MPHDIDKIIRRRRRSNSTERENHRRRHTNNVERDSQQHRLSNTAERDSNHRHMSSTIDIDSQSRRRSNSVERDSSHRRGGNSVERACRQDCDCSSSEEEQHRDLPSSSTMRGPPIQHAKVYRPGTRVDSATDSGNNRDIHFLSVVVSIPHPDKMYKNGEDASLQLTRALGVFDGVGSWNKHGVDPGHYTKELSALVEDNLNGFEHMSISDAVQLAVLHNHLKGSSTICAAEVNGRTLHGLNVGDSGLVVIRDGREIFATNDQQHRFNHPYQVAYKKHNDLNQAQNFNVDLIENDIVVLASDGLWDNVYKRDILSIIQQHITPARDAPSVEYLEKQLIEEIHMKRGEIKQRGLRSELSAPYREFGKLVKKIALQLGTTAYNASQRVEGSSPFSKKARLEGQQRSGGKADDITIVVGAAVSAKDEKYRLCIEAVCSNHTS